MQSQAPEVTNSGAGPRRASRYAMSIATVEEIIAEIRAGRMVILVDEGRSPKSIAISSTCQ